MSGTNVTYLGAANLGTNVTYLGAANLKPATHLKPVRMADSITLWSQEFLGDTARDAALCFVEELTWQRITARVGGRRIFGRFTIGATEFWCALGAPVREVDSPDAVYLPFWLLDLYRLEGVGEPAEVTWMNETALPAAERIVLRPHDTAFFHGDAREEMERQLTRIGILRQGDTLLMPLSSLGGYLVGVDVVRLVPPTALMDGEDVPIEFEEAVDSIEAPVTPPVTARPPTPIPPEVPFFPEAADTSGNVIGGTVRRMADGRAWNPYRA